ncbi:MAG: low specificity L-threonine aldolase [Desulfobacteraceae bacterium]|nr:MAG: low specificity L-threonine aldolase [Desulfobacteraceae bacterium]
MVPIKIDLYSDTITRPTQAMRAFMAQAPVGDEQQKEDPSVNQLVEMVCDLLGKEDAIFLPSGTMCNQIAVRVHCRAGDEMIMDQTAHVRHYETAGAAALSGVQIYPLIGQRGIFSINQFQSAIRGSHAYDPRSRLILIEQTSNMGGGSVWPLDAIRDICDLAHQKGLVCHMDGARLFNAVTATRISAKEYSKHFDSVFIDFSKGLGAPVGGALAGSKAFIQEAWRFKHQFGGAMRQAGIIAAGATYGLQHHLDRLVEDQEHAQLLAAGLRNIPGLNVEPVETNLVFFDVAGLGLTAEAFNHLLMQQGVRVSVVEGTRIRAVTHLDVSRSQIKEALQVINAVAAQVRKI